MVVSRDGEQICRLIITETQANKQLPIPTSSSAAEVAESVGNTELMVLVQRPYMDVVGAHVSLAARVVLFGWVALGLVGLIGGTVLWHRAR